MSSTPKKYRFHSVFLFFRRRSALTFLFRHPKFLLNFFKKLLTNYVSHSMISNVSGRQIQNNLHMREWLSWWSTTLPRSGSRVRVPSRALLLMMGNFGLQGFPFFYCNVKINYTFLLITQCFFKAFLRICEWGFRLNLLCFHSDPHITDIHRMNGLNFHLSNHFHPLFSIFSFFLYHFGRNSFISAVFTLTF